MRLSRQEFDARIAENKLTLTFIGMSGIGKTHRARQFVPLGFRHLSWDHGYTEPDPRDDLAGTDVARKTLILGREMGLPLELKDVELENLLSRRTTGAPTVEAFFAQLEKEDAVFEKKKNEAERKGNRLRYVATLEKGHAKVALKSVGSTHPFYQLSGSDNMIAFTTDRYRDTPLVVRGPGAGAEVTAAGVFADILRTSQ